MSENNSKAWNTKYGPRRVRQEAPTLQEAITAAEGLSDEPAEQVFIAASLMGLPSEEVRAALLKSATPRKPAAKSFAFVGSPDAPRTVVVERKTSRRVAATVERTTSKRAAVMPASDKAVTRQSRG